MKLRNSLFMLALTACMAFVVSSCTEELTPPVTNIPTEVKVNSLSANQISVRWTRDGDDVTADTIVAVDQATGLVAATTVVANPGNSGVVGGGATLATGKLYDIYVGSVDGRSTKLTWATATRSPVITLFETADPVRPSGLILGPIPQAASVSGADKGKIDLVLASRSDVGDPFISFQGAQVDSSQITGGRATTLGNAAFYVGGGLAKDFYTGGFSSEFSAGATQFKDFGFANVGDTTTILLVKTADNPSHYARVEIQPQAGGALYKSVVGSGGKQYRAIDVIVSYQPILDVAYAGRPVQVRRGTNERPVLTSGRVRK